MRDNTLVGYGFVKYVYSTCLVSYGKWNDTSNFSFVLEN